MATAIEPCRAGKSYLDNKLGAADGVATLGPDAKLSQGEIPDNVLVEGSEATLLADGAVHPAGYVLATDGAGGFVLIPMSSAIGSAEDAISAIDVNDASSNATTDAFICDSIYILTDSAESISSIDYALEPIIQAWS